MDKRTSLSIILVLSMITPIFAQHAPPLAIAPAQSPQQTRAATEDDDEVVRITANVVQVDAVVTDQKGKPVTDLKPEEFEISEDGRPQKITNFSYVSTLTAPGGGAASATTPAASPSPKDKNSPPAPPVRLRPEQVRRTIALVVDDLGLSFESAHFVRRALKTFVDDQMQPSDLVAIIRTGGGMGALQQFTSDKRQLHAAIERVRWNPQGRAGISAFEPIGRDLDERSDNPDSEQLSRTAGDLSKETDQFRGALFTVGTLGALNYIVRGLRDLPGRKSVLLISDGFKITSRVQTPTSGGSGRAPSAYTLDERVFEALRRLTDLANRASVVIYTMDARGLQTLGLTAEDNTADMSVDQLETRLSDRRNEFIESQEGLNYLAQQTGGLAIRDTNDLSKGISRVLDDQQGYYLIGYRPDESTFDPKTGSRRFHKISVKVKRPGLRVRSRNGFYGVEDQESRAVVPRTRVAQLMAALNSPFNSNGIGLRLTSLFGNDPQTGSFIRTLLHIEGRDIVFTKEADGWHKAVLDVLVIATGDNEAVLDQITNTYTVRVRGKTYERALATGFTYTINLPVKRAGAYQLRAALRDSASERVGAASQFVEVPDMGRNRLTLSGIVVGSSNAASTTTAAAAAAAPDADAMSAQTADAQATAAVRRFKQGMVLQYDYAIFNAKVDKATSRPQLQTQVRLFRDGQPVYTGNPKPFNVGNQTDLKRLVAGGALRLGTDMPPGEYVLQVIVTDSLAGERERTATQWIDFDIIK